MSSVPTMEKPRKKGTHPQLPDPSIDTIPKLFFHRAELWKDRIAMRHKILGIWQEFTWDDYRENVIIAANALLALGFSKGERISILSENNPEWLYCDIATICCGGVTVGIYPTNSSDEVEYIVGHSESQVFFAEDEEQLDKILLCKDRLPDLKKIVVYDMKGLRDFKDPMVMSFEEFMDMGRNFRKENPDLLDSIWPAVKPEDIAFIVYTSGTTGRPKGAMLSNYNVVWTNVSLGGLALGTHARDGEEEILSFLPLCHVAERNMTTFNSLVGGQIINFSENLDTVPRDLREVAPTIFFAVPRFWEKFYSTLILTMQEATWLEKKVFAWAVGVGKKASEYRLKRQHPPSTLRLMDSIAHFLVFRNLQNILGLHRTWWATSGGAPIAPEILRFFHSIGIPVREVYGQTEDTGPTSIHLYGDIKIGTVGRPIPDTEVKIAEDGEILVKGPHVFQGYLKEPELTAQTIVDGWLHSGDVGQFDEEGYLKITDRKKDIIITAGGKNITPQFIENKLKFSPYINDAVIIGERRKYLSALIMIDKENVMDYAQNRRIPFTTYKSLCHKEEIIELIEQEVRKVNSELARVENIRKFRLIDVELTSEDSEMTATMKLKRNYVNEKFKDLIEDMYKSG